MAGFVPALGEVRDFRATGMALHSKPARFDRFSLKPAQRCQGMIEQFASMLICNLQFSKRSTALTGHKLHKWKSESQRKRRLRKEIKPIKPKQSVTSTANNLWAEVGAFAPRPWTLLQCCTIPIIFHCSGRSSSKRQGKPRHGIKNGIHIYIYTYVYIYICIYIYKV